MFQLNIPAVVQELSRWPQHLATTFPLLTRELIEQSARKRTFILRTVYAACLYGFTLWGFWAEAADWSNQSFNLLGRGRDLFEVISTLQFMGVYLFLPAMTSGVLTIEKERDTLALLLLTRLGPWSILLGKLFSRLASMGSFLLLSLPLIAVAYSLGGIESDEILSLAWALFATSLQVGSLSLACSAWCRTTAAAFMTTYLVGAIFIIGPEIFFEVIGFDRTALLGWASLIADSLGWIDYREGDSHQVTAILFGPLTMGATLSETISRSVPIMMFSGVCLVVARVSLWRRAFIQPSNVLLKIFRSLDKVFHRMNQNRVTKGIVVIHEDVSLPAYDPIRWRETKKRSLGTTRYLIRLLIVLEVPVWIGMLLPSDNGTYPDRFGAPHVTAWLLWIAATLVLAIQSTGLIGLERSRQTLDVLLTSPMESELIVREKFAGVWRMIHMLWIPFATIYLFQCWWSTWAFNRPVDSVVVFGVIRGFLATMIYPPLIAAIGFYFGMRCRSQTQAVLVALGTITLASVFPIAVVELFNPNDVYESSLFGLLKWFSPAIAISQMPYDSSYIHFNYGYQSAAGLVWFGMYLHFIICGALLWWLWSRTLSTFAFRVQRNDGQVIDEDGIERLSRLRAIIGRDAGMSNQG